MKTLIFSLLLSLAASGMRAEEAQRVLGQPNFYWRNNQWQVYQDGQWVPYGTEPASPSLTNDVKTSKAAAPVHASEASMDGETHFLANTPGEDDAGFPAHEKTRHEARNARPQPAPEKSSSTIGQTTIGIGKPNCEIGQTTIGIGQPNGGIGQTTIGIGQPNGGIGQTTIGIGQPSGGIGQTTIGIGQPSGGIGRR